MRTHPLDVLSLTFGLILTAIAVVLALALWTDVVVDVGVLAAIALICSGTLLLVITLVPRREREQDPPSA